MGNFETVRLGDVATYINGYAFKPSDWSDNGLPIIRIQNLTGNDYETNYYSGDYNKKYEVVNGDILISWSASLGVYEWKNEKALLNQHIFKVVFDKLPIDKRYFVHTVSYLLNDMLKETHGSTMKHITKPRFDNTAFPYPPLETQKQIAATLDKVTHTIDTCNAILEKLDLLVKSRFVEMFGDIVYNTKQWKTYVFSEIATSRLGKMLDTKKQTGNYSFPYLANYNVQWFRFELDNLNQMDFNEKDQVEFALEEEDLLVCEGGEIGRCAIWHNEVSPCFFQKALHRVRCNKDIIIPTYLAWWFRFNCDNNGFSEIEGAKATIAHLPGAKLKKLSVVVPPLYLQNQFADFVTQIDKSKLAVKQVLEKAETLKKALMQEYFG